MIEPSLKDQLILDLYTIKAIKFGKFKLKSGIVSPYYLDLRVLVSYPHILQLVSDVFWEKMRVLYFDVVVGVPYTAIPIATAIGLKHEQSMIFVRKERKDYGTKKLIEGEYHRGQKAIVVDDVITNGESKLLTIKPLEDEGLTVEDIVVLVDREQGGPELLQKKRYQCHSLYVVHDIFKTLLSYKRIDSRIMEQCIRFTKKTRRQFLNTAS